MSSDQILQSFIVGSFRSVWALEVLKFLAANSRDGFSKAELVERLRASDVVVTQSVAALNAAGLVSLRSDGRFGLAAIGGEQRQLVDDALALYRTSPDKVRRMIVSGTSPAIAAFADAFRLRKE